MTLARPDLRSSYTSLTAASMSCGWTMATPARRPGSWLQKSASQRLKMRAPAWRSCGVESGNGKAAPQGGSLLFWKSGKSTSATMPSPSSSRLRTSES